MPNDRATTGNSTQISPLILVALVFLASGAGLLAFATWFAERPASLDSLQRLTGIVERASDIKHYKEPADTQSYELSIKAGSDAPVALAVVKQHVSATALTALVGHTVTALHSEGLIYELKTDQGTLFTYGDVAEMLAAEAAVVRWGGIVSLAIAAGLFVWNKFAKRGVP